MDKKSKQRRHNTISEDELKEITPHGASFDTEEGRAAQGMRQDIGQGDQPSPFDEDDNEVDEESDPAAQKVDPDDAAGKASA